MEDENGYSNRNSPDNLGLFIYLRQIYHSLADETNRRMNDDEDFTDSSDGFSVYNADYPDEDSEDFDNAVDILESDDSSSDAMSEASTVVTGEDQQASQSGTETEVENEEQPDEEIVQYESKSKTLQDDSIDEDQRCPICLEVWTNAGEHRLCSLRCGHLFGFKCITQWFSVTKNASARKCPECNTKASNRDIRILYAKSLRCIDTSEIEKVKVQLEDTTYRKDILQNQVSIYESNEAIYRQQIHTLNQTIYDLKKQVETLTSEKNSFLLHHQNKILKEKKVFDICNNNSCRVMAYNPWYKSLIVCAGTMINKICTNSLAISSKIPLHDGPIRDISFQEQHPNYLLTVGFDKKVMLSDIRTNTLVHSFTEQENLWSCSWSNYSTHNFFAGGNKGIIVEYDIRNLQCGMVTREHAEDKTPVVSLVSIPNGSLALPAGGYLACQFNSCYAYCFKEGKHIEKKINIDGPFASLRYNEKDNHVLVSCKPTIKTPTRHIVYMMEKSNDNILFNKVHTFKAGNCQKYLARPCYMNLQNDTMVVASNESENLIVAWSISSGQQVYTIPVQSESVLDICAFESGNDLYKAVLTRNRLQIYCRN